LNSFVWKKWQQNSQEAGDLRAEYNINKRALFLLMRTKDNLLTPPLIDELVAVRRKEGREARRQLEQIQSDLGLLEFTGILRELGVFIPVKN
jgi:hypothetical protein